jgi:dTDP-4-amino-4,6-dideoxygalactose transaminase
MSPDEGIVLCHPHIPRSDTLDSRWIGQGPKVDQFENSSREKFNLGPCVAVGSGTDALHLAYVLAGIRPGDEVVAPVFTCIATNSTAVRRRENQVRRCRSAHAQHFC